jgi:hypothetical protein
MFPMEMLQILWVTLITSIVWFIVGGIVYMNPWVAKIYAKYRKHPSMKHFKTQGQYLVGVFLVAGFLPIFLIAIAYQFIRPIDWILLGFILVAVRIFPRLCDMWMQTSYPNKLLQIELINGVILSFVIAYMFSILF